MQNSSDDAPVLARPVEDARRSLIHYLQAVARVLSFVAAAIVPASLETKRLLLKSMQHRFRDLVRLLDRGTATDRSQVEVLTPSKRNRRRTILLARGSPP